MGFNPLINFNLNNLTRKRRVLTDPTENYNYDYSVPNDLPVPTNATPLGQKIGLNKMDWLSKILDAASSGYAVATSNNPGETLSQQLLQRRQENLQQQQFQQEMLKQQRQFEQQGNLQKSEQQYGKEQLKSEQQFKKEQQTQIEQLDLSLSDTKFQQSKQLQQDDNEARVKLQKLSQDFQSGEARKNQDFQKELQTLRDKGDIKQVEIKTVMGALLSSTKYHKSASISDVMNIISKLQNDVALTKQDTATIDHAIQLQSRVVGGGSSSSGGSAQTKFNQKSFMQQQNDENDIIKKIVTDAKTPMINPTTGDVVKDINGKPMFINADAQEIAERVRSAVTIYRDVTGFKTQQNQQMKQSNLPSESEVINNVTNFLDQGGDPNNIDISKLTGNLKQRITNLINQRKAHKPFSR